MSTGLTEQEKESLLKALLCYLSIEVEYTSDSDKPSYILKPFNGEIRFEGLTEGFGKMVLKAMDNLRELY